MRRAAPRPLAVALEGVTATLAPATPLAAIQAHWPEAVGDAIATQALPVAEREGVVTVACESAVWAHELSLLAPQLVDRLNGRLGRPLVRSLRCRATGRSRRG